jgi:D-sedoheptulose 7-phosphate isomerase
MEWATLDTDLSDSALDAPPRSVLRDALSARRAAWLTALYRLEQQSGTLEQIADQLTRALRAGNKLLIVGNGGSAAEAQHFAGELVGRFLRDRQPYAALALTSDSSVLTSIGNDYGFEAVFERQVAALGRPGDALLAFSTSGASPNVLRAAAAARALGMLVVAITGDRPSALDRLSDFILHAPATDTPLVQELHMLVTHLLCQQLEHELCAGASGALERV